MERREPSSILDEKPAMSAMTEALDDDRFGETVPYGVDAPAEEEAKAKDTSGAQPEHPTGNDLMSEFQAPKPPRGGYAFASGARPLDGYTIKRAVGRGGFGEVYYAVSDSGREVALKLILRNLDIERRGVVQCMNLKCLNLLTIFDLKPNDAGDLFVIMEYVAGPSLAKILHENPRGLPPGEVRHWMKGLVNGVAHLHDNGVVHRDLKPANLFLEEGVVKIGDYGLAKLIASGHDAGHSESIGTCHYMAPEIRSGHYGKSIDVYAVGVILHELVTGRVPFDGQSATEILMRHMVDRPDLSIVPEPYRAIVARALAKDPNQRPGRVQDLLLPEDAPRVPEVRIIGARPTVDDSHPVVVNQARPNRAAEPVIRIDDDDDIDAQTLVDGEPVFYIGPDTTPPPPATQAAARKGEWREKMRKPGEGRRNAPAPGRSPGFGFGLGGDGRDWLGRPVEPESIPPAPLALTGRAKMAELTASMLWAALILAALSLATVPGFGIDLQREPQRLAFFYGVSLMAAWMALIVAKGLEERRGLDGWSRRIIAGVAGAFVGVGAALLAYALKLGPALEPSSPAYWNAVDAVTFFGVLFFIVKGWQDSAARGRPRRSRILPLFWSTLFAALIHPTWKSYRVELTVMAFILALTIQIASPWSAQAARYAKYLRKSEKAKRKAAA